jgi:signal transduction histidine kinase
MAVRHDLPVELHVYRIVQQACSNALTHSHARCVTVRGHVEAGSIDLAVEDDGVGFEAEGRLDLSRLTAHKHFGLAGMFERANIVGAKLQVDSAPGSGTRIRVTWNAASR